MVKRNTAVSLQPLPFETALKGLLAVNPNAVKSPKKKRATPMKKPAKKRGKK